MKHTRSKSDLQRPLGAAAPPVDAGEAGLIAKAQGGDRGAFEELVRGHYEAIYASAFRLVGNHEDAEDLAQDCFVKAEPALRWYRGEGRFLGWLRRILVHLARDRFRSAGRKPASFPLPEGFDYPAPGGPTGEVRQREFTQLLEAAIQGLPGHLRVPLVLRALEGLDYSEIAEATGVTEGTARTQVMRARKALQRVMGKHVGGADS